MGALPEVTVSILQNSLGLQDPSQGDALAIVGPAVAGAFNTPALYGRAAALVEDLDGGILVEAGATGIEATGRPVVVVRTETTTAGAQSDLDASGVTGTCEVALTAGAEPIDDFEPYILWIAGCTVGTTGGSYQWSEDGGRTLSPTTALGTATVIELPGGASFDLNPPEDALVTYVADLRTQVLAHFAEGTSVHLAADATSGAGIGSAPTDLATSLARVNQIRAAVLLHAADTSAHTAADAASFASLPAAATTYHGAVDLAIAIAAALEVHEETEGSVHGAADTNLVTADEPTHGTLVAGDSWSCRTSGPLWNNTQLDTALLALQNSGYQWKTLLVLGPITATATCTVLSSRLDAMESLYKFRKVFGHFRRPNVGESASAYLTAFKAVFDTVTDYRLRVAADVVEYLSSATRPRIYARSPAILAAAEHVRRGPATSLAYVEDGLGALPFGASIKDTSLNPKHHDEALDPGLDAARALALRSWPPYPGKAFFTRDRTLGALGTDFTIGAYWAVVVECLDVVVPILIGRIQDNPAVDPDTGRLLEEEAGDLEERCNHALETKVQAKGWVSSARVRIDRTVNLLSSPIVPLDLEVVPRIIIDAFALTTFLKNPQYSNA